MASSTRPQALFEISKGKHTTDPSKHSGQGIFFTSRSFDKFILESNGIRYIRENQLKDSDWSFESSSSTGLGTKITLQINTQSTRQLAEVFRSYQNPDDLGFNKTEILVELGRNPEDTYISRSQAKHVVSGLERFENIIFDFRHVKMIGQGFADQVFRVWAKENPEKNLRWINANSDVDFMIKRTLKP